MFRTWRDHFNMIFVPQNFGAACKAKGEVLEVIEQITETLRLGQPGPVALELLVGEVDLRRLAVDLALPLVLAPVQPR